MHIIDSIRGVCDLGTSVAPILGFLSTLVLCVLAIKTTSWHGRFSFDSTEGVQKFHTLPTSRIGGIPIVLGLLIALYWTTPETRTLLHPLLLAGIPAFLFGTLEDLTKRVGVPQRLFATMASGLIACLLTGYSLTRVDVVGLDTLLAWTPLALLFTAFAIGGIANAINIIDGFNGLASSSVTFAFTGFALMAYSVGDQQLASLAILFAAVSLGFFVVNWPFGKIFLGDGGAYSLGFALGWVAVLLVSRNPSVSPFGALLVCVHPVTEVLFSIYRRKVRHSKAGMPDSLHFHSLIKRRYLSRWLNTHNDTLRNSMTGILVGSITLAAVVIAQFTLTSTLLSLIGLLLLSLGYVALYARIVRFAWCSPISFLFVNPRLDQKKQGKAAYP